MIRNACLAAWLMIGSSQPEKHSETFPHIGEDFDGSGCGELDPSSVPIQILDVVRRTTPVTLASCGEGDFERIASPDL